MSIFGVLTEAAGDFEGAVEHAARSYAPGVQHTQSNQSKAAEIILKAGEKQKVNPAYVWGVFGTESSYGTDNAKGGPFQFEPATAKQYGYPLGVNEGKTITNWKAFEKQAEVAASYLRVLGINKNPQAALEKYNSGKSGKDAVYYQKVVAHAKTFNLPFASEGQNKQETEKVEAEKNAWGPEGGAWSKLTEIGIGLILLFAGALLLIYGIAVAVRSREKAFSNPYSDLKSWIVPDEALRFTV